MLDINVKVSGGLGLTLARILPRLRNEVNLQIKRELQAVQAISSREHRYQSRSGMLNKAYRMELSNFTGTLRLTKEETGTPYAWAIHSGRPDWKNYVPDEFFFKAGLKRKPFIVTNIRRAVRRGLSG
jgi:hypothetical protein